MFTTAHWVFFSFVIIILLTLVWRKKPILPGAVGLIAVGYADQSSITGAIEISFRALALSTQNLLVIILLIGMIVGMTKLLQETEADQLLVKPLQKLRGKDSSYWILGIVMWVMTLLLWPTPAVTLLGAVIIPTLKKTGIKPMAMAMSLTIFGEGMGLSGDYIIQGAPSLLSKSTGIPIGSIINSSLPIVFTSGLIAAFVGFLSQKTLYKVQKINLQEFENTESKYQPGLRYSKKAKKIGFIVISGYLLTIGILLFGNIKGDSASSIIGGVTLLIIIAGVIIKDGVKSFSTFIDYISHGFRFSMGVFTPIVIMAGFFFLGTEAGTHAIFHREGLGYFADFAQSLSKLVPLNKLTVCIFVIITAILGSMDGSGFSGIPLTGGIAVAMSKAAGLPLVPLAILGQVTGIWTGAVLIPWGFTAVTAAIVGVEATALSRYNFLPYLSAVLAAFFVTLLRI